MIKGETIEIQKVMGEFVVTVKDKVATADNVFKLETFGQLKVFLERHFKEEDKGQNWGS